MKDPVTKSKMTPQKCFYQKMVPVTRVLKCNTHFSDILAILVHIDVDGLYQWRMIICCVTLILLWLYDVFTGTRITPIILTSKPHIIISQCNVFCYFYLNPPIIFFKNIYWQLRCFRCLSYKRFYVTPWRKRLLLIGKTYFLIYQNRAWVYSYFILMHYWL